MKSNYRKLGDYIQEVKEKNTNLRNLSLLGVSVSKNFIPSIANTNGTDFSKYKIVKKNQFTYIPDTSRRGDKIGIALLLETDDALVSQAYTVFEIIDTELLNPEYLMMWFKRPEFDRYARFMSYGSVREIFSWEDMCEVELPIPDIDMQREIVREYNIIQDNIKNNESIIKNLENTAQAIYKEWFVDFNFPDEQGKPYKANGGAMVYDSVLEKEIPEGWEVGSIGDFCTNMRSGATPKRDVEEYWNSKDIPWLKTGEIENNIIYDAEEYISHLGYQYSSTKILPINTVLMAMYGGGTVSQLAILKFEACTNQACCGMICKDLQDASYLYFHLLYNQEQIKGMAIGGAQENLSKEVIAKLPIVNNVIFDFSEFIELMAFYTKKNNLLKRQSTLPLSKMSA